MLCLPRKELPRGPDWIYEIKFDGYRAIAVKNGKRVELFSRNQNKLTAAYAPVVEAVRELPCRRAVLDGEIVALDEQGRSRFQLLQMFRLAGGAKPPLVYYAFDLPGLEGKSLLGVPLRRRKELLQTLLSGSEVILFSAGLEAHPEALLEQCRAHGLEGVVAKRGDSVYEPNRRSGAWVKFKLVQEQEFVVGGYTRPEGSRDYFGALLVGYFEGGKLLFASKVGTGFDQRLLKSLHQRFQPLVREECPFADLPRVRAGRSSQGMSRAELKRCRWLEPALVCQVRFTEWTREGTLRHPVFLGLREDRTAAEVARQSPE